LFLDEFVFEGMADSIERNRAEASDDIKTILYIDAYDSFTCNIVDLLEETLKVVVTVIRIDTPLSECLQKIASRYDAVVAGPGPGTPSDAKDIGHMKELWKLQGIPILGICLGFQSLYCEHGATIERLPEPRHGRVVTFTHSASDIFRDLPDSFHVTLYHSLQARLDHPLERPGAFMGDESERWNPSRRCSDLQLLAWYREVQSADGATLIAVRHRSKPFWGVQFYPELCKSDDTCRDLVSNWWADV
jgi:para-aminobenzoate synthetase